MKNLIISIKITILFCITLLLAYVLVLWLFAGLSTPNFGKVNTIKANNKIVGVENIGQNFSSEKYFWSRPSAVNYNGSGSGGSNKGITNPNYLRDVSSRIDSFLIHHPYLKRSEVPSEMVTASGSGLDPHITIESAYLQVIRVAKARKVKPDEIKNIIDSVIETPIIGISVINVLKLNIAMNSKLNK